MAGRLSAAAVLALAALIVGILLPERSWPPTARAVDVPVVPAPALVRSSGSIVARVWPHRQPDDEDGGVGGNLATAECGVDGCQEGEAGVDETGAGGGSGELAFDTSSVRCWRQGCKGTVLRALRRVRMRLRRGVEAGTTLPYLRVRYSPVRDESAQSYDAPSINFTQLRLVVRQARASLPSIHTDERYTLVLGEDGKGELQAATVAGALHGLETFIQLVRYDGQAWVLPNLPLRVEDGPRFAWRGLLVDSARHFLPVASVLRTLDGMAAMKLNVLHWHLTDAQAFTVQLASHPELAQRGALHPRLSYSTDDIRRVVAYARDRGIRVVPELDVPGHTASWGQAYPDLIVHCDSITQGQHLAESINRVAMHPLKEEVFALLTDVLTELAKLFPDEYLHLGGDEVDARCWASDPELKKHMRRNGGAKVVQSHFTARVSDIASKLGKKVVLWEEAYDGGRSPGASRLESSTVVNVWHHRPLVRAAARDGHKVVLSWGAYLDRFNPTDSGGHWAYFNTWSDMFHRMLLALPSGPSGQHVLGAEASSWGETVDEHNSDERVFARLPGVAERLWIENDTVQQGDEDNLRWRMAELRCGLLRSLGIRAGPAIPDYCDVASGGPGKLPL